MACCVLHNICLDHDDANADEYCQDGVQYMEAVHELPDITIAQNHEASTSATSSSRRQHIFNAFLVN